MSNTTGSSSSSSGVVGAVENLGSRLIASLPAQFLMLVLMNMIFIMSLLSFLDKQLESRERALTPIISNCMQEIPLEVMKDILNRIGKQ